MQLVGSFLKMWCFSAKCCFCKKNFPQETILPEFFCFLTKTMHFSSCRRRTAFTIKDSRTWDRDPAHERTGAWSANAKKLLSCSRVHIKTKSKWNICLWSDKLKCNVSSTNVKMFHAGWQWLSEAFTNIRVKYFLYTLTLKTFWYLVTFVSKEDKNNHFGFSGRSSVTIWPLRW